MIKTLRGAVSITTDGQLKRETMRGAVNINYWWIPYA